MRTLLDRYLPLRNQEGGGGAGGAGAGDGGGDAAGNGSAGGDGGQAPAAGEDGAASGPYRPEGLADTMFGKDDRETIDKLHNAVKGYRDRDAKNGVPEKPDAYQTFDFATIDASLKPHLEALASDPLFKAVADVALAERVPVGAMQKIVTTLYGEAIKGGVFEGFVDVAAERAQLVPDAVKNGSKADQDRAIDSRLQANVDFLTLLAKPGADGKAAIDAKDAKHVELMLLDTAAGNRFLEYFRDQLTGAGRAAPVGGAGADAGGLTRESLRARAAAPEMQVGHPKFDRAAWEQLQADYRKILG